MIEDNIILMNVIDDFLEDTDYKLEPIDRDVEPGDMFDVDKQTRCLINYGSTDDIINSKEFKEWIEKNEH